MSRIEYVVRLTTDGDETGMQLRFAPRSLIIAGILAEASDRNGSVLRVLVDASEQHAAERFFDRDPAVKSYRNG